MKILIISILSILILSGCANNKTVNNDNNYLDNSSNNIFTNNQTNIADNGFQNNITNTNTDYIEKIEPVELSVFETEILTDDPNRNTNIKITCNSLNEHILYPGETFSFTSTVGKATSDKGYEQANMFGSDGETIKGYGGGNCQVSSTLYNAVLAVEGLEIVERHPHSQKVYYVPEGKDAAVAYGSIDFKFKNNLDNNIKIYASSDDEYVSIKIEQIN